MKQLHKKKETKEFLKQVARPNIELAFLLRSVEDPVNVGAAFRIADCVGATRLLLTNTTPQPPHPSIAGVGRGTHRRVKWDYFAEDSVAIADVKRLGFHVCAIELATGAQPYYAFEYPEKTCLLVGSEGLGVSKATLALCDSAVFIPMYGKAPSLNVHVSLAVVAFHAVYRSIGLAPDDDPTVV
jgi:tRNA (guanosine-2'-O-)-methyltransferase